MSHTSPDRPPDTYNRTQRGPLYLITLAVAVVVLAMAWSLRGDPASFHSLLILAGIFFLVSLMFKHLTIRDEGEHLAVRYGPLPCFRRMIPYVEISSADPDRTSWLDGWGIHWVPGRGYTYNLWGFGCVRLVTRGRVIRIGSDDVDNLLNFIRQRIRERD
jgi:hypothetical protein